MGIDETTLSFITNLKSEKSCLWLQYSHTYLTNFARLVIEHDPHH